MRTSVGVSYLHADHLNSNVRTTGAVSTGPQYYYPFGAVRSSNVVTTPYRFTGQREEEALGLYYYGARWYDPELRRFIQPDTIVPQPGNPQALNRYSYCLNNPVKYTDPTGHAIPIDMEGYLLENPVTGNVMVRDTGGSGLYIIIAMAAVGRASAADRLDQILAGTAGTGAIPGQLPDRLVGQATRTHFQGAGAIRGDAGFAPEFQDDYLYAELWGFETPESRQTGHFLTAVDMGRSGGWIHSIVGHEQSSDSVWKGTVIRQMRQPSSGDKQMFLAAVAFDAGGQPGARDIALAGILDPATHGALEGRQGNSMEDLRLSIRGWRLGNMDTQGQIGTNKDLANWMALNVAGD